MKIHAIVVFAIGISAVAAAAPSPKDALPGDQADDFVSANSNDGKWHSCDAIFEWASKKQEIPDIRTGYTGHAIVTFGEKAQVNDMRKKCGLPAIP